MNQGSFNKNALILLTHIYNLTTHGRSKICRATNKWLALQMGKSEKQISRYLKYLKDENLIEIDMTKPKSVGGRWFPGSVGLKCYRQRTITPICVKPENSDQILNIYMDKQISLELKPKIVKDIIINCSPLDLVLKKNNVIEGSRLANAIVMNINADALNCDIPKDFIVPLFGNGDKEAAEELARMRKIVEKDMAEQAIIRQEQSLIKKKEQYAEKFLSQVYDDSKLLKGSTKLEQLVNWCIDSNKARDIIYDSDRLDNLLGVMTKEWKDTTYENGEYYIHIFMGEIPHKVKLLDYVPWTSDSRIFTTFEELYKEKLASIKE